MAKLICILVHRALDCLKYEYYSLRNNFIANKFTKQDDKIHKVSFTYRISLSMLVDLGFPILMTLEHKRIHKARDTLYLQPHVS